MEEENMEDVDLEEQPLAPPPPVHYKSPSRKLAVGDHRRHSCAVVATPVRALSLVVLTVGVLFGVHLLAHDPRTLALLGAEWLCIFFVMSCVTTCERDEGGGGGCGGGGVGAVAEVALWSFAMAVTVTMTFWVAAGLPLPAVVVLYLLSLLAVSACFAVLLHA